MSKAEIARDKLFANLKELMGDVEELLSATAEQTDDSMMASLRERSLRTLESTKSTLAQGGRKAIDSSRQGAEAAISYVQDNPWATAGVAAGAAMVIACLLLSRDSR